MPKKRQWNRKTKQARTAMVLNESKPSTVFVLWDSLCRYLSHRYVTASAFALLLIVVFIRYAAPLQDPDLWWHMELGEYLVKNITLKPDHSIYSWTVADPNWVYNGWIPQIFFYIAHYAGGIPLLYVSYCSFFILIIALFVYFNYRLNQPLNLFYLLSILSVMVCLHLNATLRPEMFSVLFITLTVFILFSAWTLHWTVYFPHQYRYFGFGVGEYLPEKAADFLLEHKLEGPIFNTYEIGGYLLWRLYPEYRVFIDPRHGPYTKHLSDEYRIFETGSNFEQFTAKYPFKTVIVKLQWIHLVTNFFKSPDWRLVYFDTSAAIFAHKTVKLPEKMAVDLGPDRFKHVRSYEALVYIMYAYLNMDDFKNAWHVIELIKNRYNFGDYREKIEITIENIRKYENERNVKKPF